MAMEISKRIILARKKRGLTQEELADLTNLTVRTIQRIESGESQPRAFTLKALAKSLGVDFEDLVDESRDENISKEQSASESNFNPDDEKHFLKILCLSCFSYLVIPLVHFLIPIYIFKKSDNSNPKTIAFVRKIIRSQVYWVVALSLLLLLTMTYNFIAVIYFNESYLLHYIWPFLGMYILNAFIITNSLYHVNYVAQANRLQC